jgi:hypothetical protein
MWKMFYITDMSEQSYYYLNGKVQVGPFSLDKLKQEPVGPDTLVWNKSLPDWVEARMLPELQVFFVAPQPPSPPPPPSPTDTQSANYQPPYRSTFGNQTVRPPMPDNYLVWAILTTVLCCMPFGIVSIVQSNKVNSAYYAGDYEGAARASESAKKWAIWSAASSAVIIALYLLFIVIIAIAGSLS